MTPPILVLGNVNVDLVLGPVDGWPAIGTEVEVERAEMRAGGSAGNTALALAGLGEPYRLVASTGDDPNGLWLKGEFEASNSLWIDDPGMTTTTIGIVHAGGDRVFFTTPGHLQRARPDDLLARIPVAEHRAAVAILSGNLLMPKIRDATAPLLAALRARGWASAIDPGWPPQGWSSALRETIEEWLGLVDHALLNEDEAEALAPGASPEDLARCLRPGGTLVIKRGESGVTAHRAGRTVCVPAPRVAVIDTVGAGDTFNAGYLAGTVHGRSLEDTLADGVAAASYAISTLPRSYRPAPERSAP